MRCTTILLAVTKDGRLSYHSVVASYIEDYIKQEEKEVSLSRFYAYLNTLYKKTFVEGYDLSIVAYIQHLDYQFEKEDAYYQEVYDCKYITEILLKVLSGHQDYEQDFLPIYEQTKKETNIDDLRSFYRKKESNYHQAT